MIPRSVKRMFDQRDELRVEPSGESVVLEHRGRRHSVRLLNISPSGAMVIFPSMPHIGEQVQLQLLGRKPVSARVRWVRDGRIGVNFDVPLEDQ